jgi:RimJ/RimL family protein N-acetyltransferase
MIKLNNIAIRAIESEDLKIIKEWRNDEDLRRYFREYRDFSKGQIMEWYEGMIHSKDFEMFVIEDLSNDEVVGVTGLTYID